jgi:tetratricopeptide (TPR) repeat protein
VARWFQYGLTLLPLFVIARPAIGQRAKKDAPEFTKQAVLIVSFAPGVGADARLGRRAADAVRSRAAKLINNDREVEVIEERKVVTAVEHAGYNPDSMFALTNIRQLARLMRADEIVIGTVENTASGTKMRGEIVLIRDEHLRQPLPEVSAPKLDSAAVLFARSLHAARGQMIFQRRCENALHEGSGQRALAAARAGVAAYPPSTIARTCLMWTLHQTHAPPAEVLGVAQQLLAVDSSNVHAMEYAAIALDSLGRRDDAASMWLRFADTDTASHDLMLKVSYALFNGGNSKRAEPFIVRVSDRHPEDLSLVQQKWRISYENRSWTHAIEAAEVMLARDSVAQNDSTFYLKLGTAYHAANLPFKALETLSHALSAFPNDGRVYSLYAQYIKGEADSVIPRGLALFPRSADLAALNAKELRARGKVAESLDATKRAVELDSTMAQGRLMVAQLEMELGRPDSALISLRKAVAGGEDSSVVAQFALAKGNALYRAASGTKTAADFGLALRFLAFADTVRSSLQSKFLVGAAALGIAQTALTEATKVTDKVESCRLARLGADMVPVARIQLQAGQEAFAEAAKQSLDYLAELDPYVARALAAACDAGGPGPHPPH